MRCLVAGLLVWTVACGKDAAKPPAAGDAGIVRVKDLTAAQAEAKRAAIEACKGAIGSRSSAGPDRGLAALLDACGVCGVSFDPLVALSRIDPDDGPGDEVPTADQAIAVIEACGGVCSTRAREDIFDPLRLAHDGQAPSRPWRKLAEACPDAMGIEAKTRRFARGTWFALYQVARALGADAPKDLEFPLPPYSEASTGLALPDVVGEIATADWIPRIHVSVTDKDIRIGALPWVAVEAGKLVLVPAPGDDYPGTVVAPGELAAAYTKLRDELIASPRPANASVFPVILAPRGLPAKRVAEVVAALGTSAYLGATPKPAGDVAWAEPVSAIEIELVTEDEKMTMTVEITAATTTAELAAELGLHATHGGPRARIVTK